MSTRTPSARATPPDVLWFRRAFEKAGLSQNEVAHRIDMDRSAFSRTLKGTRRIQVEEMKRLAFVLGVTEDEVLRHAGGKSAKVSAGGKASAEVAVNAPRAPLAGTVDAVSGVVRLLDVLPTAGTLALAIRGDDFLDGRHLLVSGDLAAPSSAAKDMGVLQLDDGRMVVGKFKPGFTKGRFDVGPVLGFGGRHDDVGLVGLYELVGMDLGKN